MSNPKPEISLFPSSQPTQQPLRQSRSHPEPISHPQQAPITPFAARLGGNQEFVVDRDDPRNAALLQDIPDAASHMTLRQALDLRGFRQVELWRAALMECMGTLLLVYATGWIGLSPAAFPPPPNPESALGVFSTAAFVGPLIGGITTAILTTMFIFCFAAGSGAHLNPLITIATFFARLTSLPRTILYVGFQLLGGSLAGLLIRASYDSRNFKVGGCWLNPAQVSVSSALATEFSASLVLLFIAFGVGLDPRQRKIFGPSLAPIFIGLAAGTIIFGMAFPRPGYGGSAMNPARCFGAYVGSYFPNWHWVHWVGTILASITHGLAYWLVPPWSGLETSEVAHRREVERLATTDEEK